MGQYYIFVYIFIVISKYQPVNIQTYDLMNRGNTQRSPSNRSPYERKRRSPISISPLNRTKPSLSAYNQSSPITANINSQITEQNPNENILKNMQQPLQFSANRKLKYKVPQNYQQNSTTYVNSSSAYTYNTNVYQNSKLNNENKIYDYNHVGKNQSNQIQKLKNTYQVQIKAILDNNRNTQAQFQIKIKNVEKQKTYWRENYSIIKEQFQNYVLNCERRQKQMERQRQKLKLKQRQRQRQRQRSRDKNKQFQEHNMKQNRNQTTTQPSNKPNIDENIKLMQQQIQKYLSSLKMAEDQIYALNKFKAELTYQLNIFKQQSKKANNRVTDLMSQIQNHKRQVFQLKQKIKKSQQENVMKSMDEKINGLQSISFSLDSKPRAKDQICDVSPQKILQRSHSNSKQSRSKSSSQSQFLSLSLNCASPRNKVSSKHHRSNSGHSHRHSQSHRSSSSNSRQLPNHSVQFPPVQLNFEQCKQIDRLKHSHRKVQKALYNQNTETIVQCLKKLNQKYSKIYEQQQKNSQYFNKQFQSRASSDIFWPSDSSIYRYNIGTDSKIIGKPIVVKYL